MKHIEALFLLRALDRGLEAYYYEGRFRTITVGDACTARRLFDGENA